MQETFIFNAKNIFYFNSWAPRLSRLQKQQQCLIDYHCLRFMLHFGNYFYSNFTDFNARIRKLMYDGPSWLVE